MKIIRKAIKTEDDPLWIGRQIACNNCGCIFELEASDKDIVKEERLFHHSSFDGYKVPNRGMGPKYTEFYVGGISVDCPECSGNIVEQN
jgi:hypothetical protein